MDKISIFQKAKLYPILDWDFCNTKRILPENLVELWANYPEFISFYQFRAKSLTDLEYKKNYLDLQKKFPNFPIIVNDFWEIALEVKAFGIHIGKEDFQSLSFNEKNQIRQTKNIFKGTSSHNLQDLENLESDFWDYTGYGPIFPTNSKQTNNPPLGINGLKQAILHSKIPLVPIGGINVENLASLFGFGKITPASISMMGDQKSLIKILDFISKIPHPV